MPFYFRKSVQAGPFRFNFSKGGVGASVGVRGLRFGTGPRGHYVHAGRSGLFYRATIGRPGEALAGSDLAALRPASEIPTTTYESGVAMVELESGDVMAMRDETATDLLDEIDAKRNSATTARFRSADTRRCTCAVAPASTSWSSFRGRV